MKLQLGGLKDELIKCLDEVLRLERETAEKDAANSFDCNSPPVIKVQDAETVHIETINTVEERNSETVKKAGGENQEIENAVDHETKDEQTVEKAGWENPEMTIDAASHKDEQVDHVMAQVDFNNIALSKDREKNKHEDLPIVSDSASAGEELAVHATTIEICITVTRVWS